MAVVAAVRRRAGSAVDLERQLEYHHLVPLRRVGVVRALGLGHGADVWLVEIEGDHCPGEEEELDAAMIQDSFKAQGRRRTG
jgi:hypothetical protein